MSTSRFPTMIRAALTALLLSTLWSSAALSTASAQQTAGNATVTVTVRGTGELSVNGETCSADHGLFSREATTCSFDWPAGTEVHVESSSPFWAALKEWGDDCRSEKGSTCDATVPEEGSLAVTVRFSVNELAAIGLLLLTLILVMSRVKRVDVGHDQKYRLRRIANWLPLGLLYAFLYMGRYNLKVSQHALESIDNGHGSGLMDSSGFGIIFGIGTAVYGASFLINGPLTDRRGGRTAILIGGAGSAVMNALMAAASWSILNQGPASQWIIENFKVLFSVLYAANMYFQSFGAVAIVKINAPWFHVRERGFFGAIFGVLISLGVYFAYDWGYWILNHTGEGANGGLPFVFGVPATLLAIFWVIVAIVVRNEPADAGLKDFDTGDASSGDDGPQLPAMQVFKMMFSNPIIVTIACIEFCSGFLRQAIMQWFRTFAKHTNETLGLKATFVYDHWGMMLCCAGILGGVFAGVISDRFFQSRRGPVAGVLYAIMLVSAIVLTFSYASGVTPWLVVFMSLAVIGVHGMLSGTASMDFGGRKNAGIAVGIIDGFVYAGTAVMSLTYAAILPAEELNDQGQVVGPITEPDNWISWPISMIPLAAIGFFLALRVWNAKPKPKGSGAPGKAAETPRKAA